MYILIRSDVRVGEARFWMGSGWVAGSANAKQFSTWADAKAARKKIEEASGLEIYIEIKGDNQRD